MNTNSQIPFPSSNWGLSVLLRLHPALKMDTQGGVIFITKIMVWNAFLTTQLVSAYSTSPRNNSKSIHENSDLGFHEY